MKVYDDHEFLDVLKNIPEIDIEIGLSRVEGNVHLYQTTMKIFMNNLRTEFDRTTGFLEDRNIEYFGRSVHAIKSMLSTIGAIELADIALEIELAAKSEPPDVGFCRSNYPFLLGELKMLDDHLAAVLG